MRLLTDWPPRGERLPRLPRHGRPRPPAQAPTSPHRANRHGRVQPRLPVPPAQRLSMSMDGWLDPNMVSVSFVQRERDALKASTISGSDSIGLTTDKNGLLIASPRLNRNQARSGPTERDLCFFSSGPWPYVPSLRISNNLGCPQISNPWLCGPKALALGVVRGRSPLSHDRQRLGLAPAVSPDGSGATKWEIGLSFQRKIRAKVEGSKKLNVAPESVQVPG